MRAVLVILAGLLISSFPAVAALAAPLETAKVYRDYPGYLKPTVCENPNLGAAPAPPPAGMPSQPEAGADRAESCSSVPYEFRSDDPVNVPYLTLWAGWVATHDVEVDDSVFDAELSFDNGFGGGAALGYDFGPARLEIEGSYRENNADELKINGATVAADGDLEVSALLVNAYADFQTGTMVTPYLGAGVGWAQVDIEGEDDEVFAGQLAAGMLLALSPAVAIDLGYRFLMTADPDIDGVELEEVKQHTALLGLQIRF